MPKPRYALQRDASEQDIFKALRGAGVSVAPSDEYVDCWLGFMERTFPCEIKTPGTQYGKKLNKNQQRFADNWRGSKIVILRTPEEAVDWANDQRNG